MSTHSKSDPYIQVGLRMQQSQIDELDAWCKRHRLARSVAVRQAIEILINEGQAAPPRFGGSVTLAGRVSQLEQKVELLQRTSGCTGIF